MDELPLAFNVERVRAALLEGIIIPREMVNDSLRELHAQVKAERTYYFQKNGKVTDKRNVADNGARLQAIDQTLSLAGLFKPDDRRASGPSIPSFAIEVTPQGVIRIAVGNSPLELNSPVTPDEFKISNREPTAIPAGHRSVQEKVKHSIEDTVDKFNTILDELVDE